nr:MAG TPA: hypothetical protein [Caudoviricetes sp.]
MQFFFFHLFIRFSLLLLITGLFFNLESKCR